MQSAVIVIVELSVHPSVIHAGTYCVRTTQAKIAKFLRDKIHPEIRMGSSRAWALYDILGTYIVTA